MSWETVCFQVFLGYLLLFETILGAESTATTKQELLESAGLLKSYYNFSTAEECARTCVDNEAPRYCYYKFVLEYYVVLSRACEVCTPNSTNQLGAIPDCQCIQADGVERVMVSINRMLPGPAIHVCYNDKIVVDVENHIAGEEVAIHWHGILQLGSPYYDGVPYVTQCPIPSESSFRYKFTADKPGTHFYHSHSGFQKLDGVYGNLIVRAPPSREPHISLYDEDLPVHVILLSDWLHELAAERFPGRFTNAPAQEPVNVLINGKGRWTNTTSGETTTVPLETFNVTSGKRYRFRVIGSIASNCPVQLTVEGHSLLLLSQDGDNVVPRPADSVLVHTGERVDFVINANQSAKTYWIQARSILHCDLFKPSQLAILQYDGLTDTPTTTQPTYDSPLDAGVIYNPPDYNCSEPRTDAVCVNQLEGIANVSTKLLDVEPNRRIILPFGFTRHSANVTAFFKPGTYDRFFVGDTGAYISPVLSNITYKSASVPPLSQYVANSEFCNGDNLTANGTGPYHCTHKYSVNKGAIVEMIIYDSGDPAINLTHPFHIHGHVFHVFKMGLFADPSNVTQDDVDNVIIEHERALKAGEYNQPPAKDTVAAPGGGYVIIRFNANNPGWWFFHCHIIWHTDTGMSLMFHVGKPTDVPLIPFGFPYCGPYKPPPYFSKR